MSFIDDMKVFIFFGILVVVAIGGLGKRFLGWGIKPGTESKPAPTPVQQPARIPQQYPPQQPQQQQQYYSQQQQQQYPRR